MWINNLYFVSCVIIISVFEGEENLGPWKNEVSEASEAPGPVSDAHQSTLVLAANRTNRPDILNGFRRYLGGWDIVNRHYWAVCSDSFLHLWWFFHCVRYGWLKKLIHPCVSAKLDIGLSCRKWIVMICCILLCLLGRQAYLLPFLWKNWGLRLKLWWFWFLPIKNY